MNYILPITKSKNFIKFKKRFLSYFPENAFKPGQENECWIWQGPKLDRIKKNTYGTIWLEDVHYLAHRISYYLYNEPFTKNLMVCHKCNTTLCVNPKHLVLGNHTDNMNDMIASGTTVRKLNEEAVKVIKWMLKYKYKQGLGKKLAVLYKVRTSTISEIKNNHHWGWVKV
jgi:hypothetical protein